MTSKNPVALGMLANAIDQKAPELEELYEKSSDPVNVVEAGKKEIAVARTRRTLGLPSRRKVDSGSKQTYVTTLQSIVRDSSSKSGVPFDELRKTIDYSSPPKELVAKLQVDAAAMSNKPIMVWGIETPMVLPVQYGAAQLRVPASVIANFGMAALAPILLVWLGSLRLTRRRELLEIYRTGTYIEAFPHILNILPHQHLASQWESTRTNRKALAIQDNVVRVASSFGRSVVILLFAIPMVISFAYSAWNILSLKTDVNFLEFIVLVVTGFWLLIQVLELLVQEWIILWGKTFSL